MKKANNLPYSPDIVPSDFFMFGYVKGKLQGEHFYSVESLLKRAIEISLESLKTVLLESENNIDNDFFDSTFIFNISLLNFIMLHLNETLDFEFALTLFE